MHSGSFRNAFGSCVPADATVQRNVGDYLEPDPVFPAVVVLRPERECRVDDQDRVWRGGDPRAAVVFAGQRIVPAERNLAQAAGTAGCSSRSLAEPKSQALR